MCPPLTDFGVDLDHSRLTCHAVHHVPGSQTGGPEHASSHRPTGASHSPPPPLLSTSVMWLLLLQLKAMESLAKLQGPFEQLQSRHSFSTSHQKHLYTIEWININD